MPTSIACRFVLVRPANALNIGAVARAMANFGLEDLAAVSPVEHRWREARSAVYGSQVLERAPLRTLEEAVADSHLILGTASAHNRALRRTVVTLPALRSWIKRRLPQGGRIAVLFGAEKNGLENEELSRCHAILRIPTAAAAPSMNLGQAAALVAYELGKLGLERSVTEPEEPPADGQQLAGLVETALGAMAKVRLNAQLSEAARRRKVRDGLLRWRLSGADAAWLRGLLRLLSKG